MKNKIKNAMILILLLLCSITIIGSMYYYKNYPKQDFDVIIFIFSQGLETASPEVIKGIVSSCIFQVIFLFLLLSLLTIKNTKNKICINIKIFRKFISFQLFPIKIISMHKIAYLMLIIIISFLSFVRCFRIDDFIKNKSQKTKIFEEYYVDAKNVNIKFPKKNKNLIIIIGESFETTILSKENGGAWDYSIMPELEKLALENTSFSNTEVLGGALQSYGTDHSAAGNVSITSGIPLITIDFLNQGSIYKGTGIYLQGAYSIGEILSQQNYNLEIIMGSDGNFGGRKQYYVTNGNYKVFDVNYAIEQGKMTDAEKVWWGFEDDKLYEWSKEELTELASQDKPFNYIMLTADTHYTDGYLSPNVENKFDSQYENVYAYSSKSIYKFLDWIKKQDFYNDTVIVIIGDHLGMQNTFYENRINGNYTRTIYNVIINSSIKAQNTKNRQFTTMDMYPTILASLGIEIEGNRLGLGTNLYSNTPTIIEELGFDYFNSEIKKNSDFYNNYILGDEYYITKKKNENESENSNEEIINSNSSI